MSSVHCANFCTESHYGRQPRSCLKIKVFPFQVVLEFAILNPRVDLSGGKPRGPYQSNETQGKARRTTGVFFLLKKHEIDKTAFQL